MASRLRIGAALFGATALLSMSTLAASADVIVKPGPDSQKKYGHDISFLENVGNHTDKDEYSTALIPLTVTNDGEVEKVFAYCVELPTRLQDNVPLREAKWEEKHPNPDTKFNENKGKILWILTNSFPVLDIDAFREKWGDQYDEREAIGATQAALWHFSDGVEIDEKRENKDNADVVTLYKKLIEQAKDEGQALKPTLEIKPDSKSGKAGEKIGPFTITTTASEVKLTAKLPKGVTITDGAGNPLALEKDGDKVKAKAAAGDKVTEFFVNVPGDADKGEATMNVSAEAVLQAGRLFIAEDSKHKTQSLVIAKNSKVKVAKDAKADWTAGVKPSEPTTPTTTTTTEPTTPTTTTTTNNPAPGGSTDDLASTGASILWPLVGGLVLVGAGVGALFVVRRKKAGAAE
ncbi:thioester domain-containing protein [Lentzea sp. NPDC051838]|uniref:thioester domain-containing protein n=1 Tax=Lentzea sp. NPDC051838 TaxID=3154849 RepID=UPI00344A71D0